MYGLLRDKTRRSHGRSTQPTSAVIDAQSVKTSAHVAETSQVIDAGRKIKGRTRHVITDTLCLILAVLVIAANVHDTTGAKLLLDDLAAAHPTVSNVWADDGYQSSIPNHGAGLGIDVEAVPWPRMKGFEPLQKRWVIERTFGWLMQYRRLARDYEALRAPAAARRDSAGPRPGRASPPQAGLPPTAATPMTSTTTRAAPAASRRPSHAAAPCTARDWAPTAGSWRVVLRGYLLPHKELQDPPRLPVTAFTTPSPACTIPPSPHDHTHPDTASACVITTICNTL